MLKIKILSVGKNKEEWLEEALNEYIKRLQVQVQIEYAWAKNDAHLLQLAAKEECMVCLDPLGKEMDSKTFASFLIKQLEKGGSRLTFVIGGAEGLPSELKEQSTLISLSKMTFTHQIARLILIEQIYRAFEIIKGTPYHK